MKRRIPLTLAATLMLTGCVEEIKRDRTHAALVNAGIPDPTATCMAHRMAQKLSIAQLERLRALGGPKQTWSDYIAAIRRVHDNDALEVVLSSYGLCKAGIVQ